MTEQMTLSLRRRQALLLPLGALAACATKKSPITGVQIPVLPETNPLTVSASAPPVTVPPAVAMADWPQVFGSPSHALGNLAGPTGFTKAWSASIGQGGGYRQPLAVSPIVADGRIFTMDANAVVSAFAAASGARQWRTVTRPKHLTVQNIGGGIGYDSGILYATTGYAELLALDPASGKIIWRQALDFPARSAPTIAGGIVALVTQNDLLLTFDAASGTPGWRFTGRVSDSPTSVAVAGAPAFSAGILVAGFSSGSLAALDASSGTPIWAQSLASTFGQASPLDFSDIVAAPVIANGVVYAISLGQTMLAIDLHSGAKVWTSDTTGAHTIYAAGDFVYVLDTAQVLAAIHQDDGLVDWLLRMPAYKKPKKKSKPIAWSSPVMVNGSLLLVNDQGGLAVVDPVAGAITKMQKIAGPADLPPLAVGGALLVLTRDGILTAYT
jgi:outer membrane protein assembly factor BamB